MKSHVADSSYGRFSQEAHVGTVTANTLVFVYEKADRVAQWVTEFVAECGDLSSIPGSHTVVAESQLPACCPPTSTHALRSMCSHTYRCKLEMIVSGAFLCQWISGTCSFYRTWSSGGQWF